MRGEVPLAALMQEWLAEDTGPDDPDIEGQMRDLDGARHATQSLFRKEPLMPADLDALDALLKAATPRPWEADTEKTDEGYKTYVMLAPDGSRLFDALNSSATLVQYDYSDDGGSEWDETARCNFALIAAAVTALPDLLREVRIGRAAREVADALDARREWSNRDPDASELWEHRQEAERLDVALDAARARYRALLETPDA